MKTHHENCDMGWDCNCDYLYKRDNEPMLVLRNLAEIEPKVPQPLWQLTDDSIITHMGGYEYIIRLKHTDTRDKVLDWVEHLSTKTWMTTEGLKQFARLLMRERK